MMVGDSFRHDIEGALNAGWRAVLLRRSGEVPYALPAESAGDPHLAELLASYSTRADMQIRDLTTIDEFRQVVDLERAIWGYTDNADMVTCRCSSSPCIAARR